MRSRITAHETTCEVRIEPETAVEFRVTENKHPLPPCFSCLVQAGADQPIPIALR
jgi:hypothetical protein